MEEPRSPRGRDPRARDDRIVPPHRVDYNATPSRVVPQPVTIEDVTDEEDIFTWPSHPVNVPSPIVSTVWSDDSTTVQEETPPPSHGESDSSSYVSSDQTVRGAHSDEDSYVDGHPPPRSAYSQDTESSFYPQSMDYEGHHAPQSESSSYNTSYVSSTSQPSTLSSTHPFSPGYSTVDPAAFLNGAPSDFSRPNPRFLHHGQYPVQPLYAPVGLPTPTATYATPTSPWSRTPNVVPRSPIPSFGLNAVPPNSLHVNIPYNAPTQGLSGYQMLAHKLCGKGGGTDIMPIYRKFQALNHRLLLHLQDELCELEEKLQELDGADTQSRMHLGGIMPASRRFGTVDLASRRESILSKIGFKLNRYNKILVSFENTQGLRPPLISEIHDYRSYLLDERCIQDNEFKFLDVTQDLVALSPEDYSHQASRGPGYTTSGPSVVSPISGGEVPKRRLPLRPRPFPGSLVMAAVLAAIIIPTGIFPFLSGFMERMIVVFLVFTSTVTLLAQAGLLRAASMSTVAEYLACAIVYGFLMALLANTAKTNWA